MKTLHPRDVEHLKALEHLRLGEHVDGIKLYRQLRRIEKRARDLALKQCNVGISDEMLDHQHELIHNAVAKVLGKLPKGFFINGDPRGCALKLEPKSVNLTLHEDWGGYQILAPEFEYEC
jgi:hypothetical protein